MRKTRRNTSWEKDSKHYNKIVGDRGHYYHEHVVIPGVVRLLNLDTNSRVLDVGSGQGVLGRAVGENIIYMGIDNSKSLVSMARDLDQSLNHQYEIMDAMSLNVEGQFSHVVSILALQNMSSQEKVISNMAAVLEDNGRMVIVLNHPAFRIPRQSGWGEHENKIQYRYVNRYLTPLEIPINMHPGQGGGNMTWSYHVPISYYAQALASSGMVIESIEEWTSDKQSEGKAARMENRARAEIPLFMAVVASKR